MNSIGTEKLEYWNWAVLGLRSTGQYWDWAVRDLKSTGTEDRGSTETEQYWGSTGTGAVGSARFEQYWE